MKKGSILAWFFFTLIYFINFFIASQYPEFPFKQVLGSLFFVGILSFGIAYLLVKNSTPLYEPPKSKEGELLVLIGLLVFFFVSVIFGDKSITDWIPNYFHYDLGRNEIITIPRKVLIYVIVPFLMYKYLLGFKLNDFGFSKSTKDIFSRRNITVLSVMLLIFSLPQWFGGIHSFSKYSREFSVHGLLFGLPLAFIAAFFEVGLAEEFFFHSLIQDRIFAFTKSNSWSIVITFLIYGLMNVPSIYFRKAGEIEGLGAHPPFIITLSYCITVRAMEILPFSIIWIKTRNIWLLTTLHAFFDLSTYYYPFYYKYFLK